MIKIEHLTKTFNDLVAVDDLSLEIPQGEFFTFLGPNAAGKTTTIKSLVGLLRPTSGRIFVGGYDVQKDYIQAKALISYIPDFPFLYDKLTAREFLDFIDGLYPGRNNPGQEALKSELLRAFGLKAHQDKLIENYSHGMRQKLVFAAAFLHEPRVMIIDEPMVGLDPHSVHLVKDMLKKKAKEGVTIFLSTHTLSIAEELSDRIGIIDKGKLIALGTLGELGQAAGSGVNLEDIFLRLTEEELSA
ncbi:MAG: ABC transporter ATP-binding protein [Candidatus Omnitrophica bacterium]|nr:ABC transporter ATP-binding protein [Candidatus Omnitrophota bacterium]